MHRLAVVAFLSIIPVSILAQEEEKQKGFSVTGVPLVDYNRSVGVKVGALGVLSIPS